MILLLVPIMFAVALFSSLFQVHSNATTNNPRTQEVAHEVNMYRHFMFAAAQYMRGPGAGVAPGVIDWATIRTAKSTPPGLAGLSMPVSWRIVKGPTDWVACAEVLPATSSALKQLMPKAGTADNALNSEVLQPAAVSGGHPGGYVVMKATDAAGAVALAATCG